MWSDRHLLERRGRAEADWEWGVESEWRSLCPHSISLLDFSFFISPLLTALPDTGSNNKRLTGESIYSPSWQEERERCLFDRGHRPEQPAVLNLTFQWLNMERTKIDRELESLTVTDTHVYARAWDVGVRVVPLSWGHAVWFLMYGTHFWNRDFFLLGGKMKWAVLEVLVCFYDG